MSAIRWWVVLTPRSVAYSAALGVLCVVPWGIAVWTRGPRLDATVVAERTSCPPDSRSTVSASTTSTLSSTTSTRPGTA